MCPFKALEWGYGSLHISQLHALRALFPKDLTTWLTREPFNVLIDSIIMLPKILIFLKTFSINKALKRFHFVFARGLIMLM